MLSERIHLARRAAGLSLRQVAERVGVSAAAISKWETGEVMPSSDRLLALSRALGVRTEFFFRPTAVRLERPEYRKRASLPAKVLQRIEAEVVDQAERMHEILSLYPEPPVPTFEVPAALPAAHSLATVEAVADALRGSWNLGLDPIGDLTAVLEERGILVLTCRIDGERKFDGLAARVGSLPIIVVGEDWPGDRQRFTLAHELGHLILADRHSGIAIEPACNRFAGAFLAPGSEVRRNLGDRRSRLEVRELYDLKQEFGLSMAALLYRARDLEILSEAAYRSMMQAFSRSGWRRHEPGRPTASERPRLFEQLVYHALAEEMIGESKAAELLGRSLTEFREHRRLGRSSADPR